MKIKLGFEVGTGNEVKIPIFHTFITGLTQVGKTECIKTLAKQLEEMDMTVLILDVKHKVGEPRDFDGFGNDTKIYLEHPTDPMTLKGLIESSQHIQIGFQFPELIRACQKAKTTFDVLDAITELLEQQKLHPIRRDKLDVLKLLLEKVTEDLKKVSTTEKLELINGKINVIDISKFSDAFKQIVVLGVTKYVRKHCNKIALFFDEAHIHIPQGYSSASKREVTNLIKEGASSKQFVYIADQTITEIDKRVVKQCEHWLMGRQREINEAKHMLAQIPQAYPKPKTEDIMKLTMGEFYHTSSEGTTKVYIQPYWLDDETAKQVAIGKLKVEKVKRPESVVTKTPIQEKSSAKISDETMTYIDEQLGRIHREIEEIKQQNKKPVVDMDTIVKQVLTKIPKDGNIITQVAPLEKIKEAFLLDAKNKITDDMSNLSPQAKKMLKYLETRGVGVTVNELCIKCFLMKSGTGNYSTQVNSFGKELVGVLVAEKERNGKFKGLLKKRLTDLLQVHDASSEQIDNVYSHILMDLLSEKVQV